MNINELLNSLSTANLKNASSLDVLSYREDLKNKFRDAYYNTSDLYKLDDIAQGYNYFKDTVEKDLDILAENKYKNEQASKLLSKKASLYAFGGNTQTNGMTVDTGLTELDGGYKHGQGAYDGIPIGISPDGELNVAERGETVLDDYVLSDSFVVDKDTVEKYGFPKKFEGKTIAECSKLAAKEFKERGGTDNISKNTMQSELKKLRAYNDEKLAEMQLLEQLKQVRNTRMDIAQEEAERQQIMAQKQAEQQAAVQQQQMNQIPQEQMPMENPGIVQSKCGGGINRFDEGGTPSTISPRRQQALDRIDKAQKWVGWIPGVDTILGIVENSLDGTYKKSWDKTVDYFKNTVADTTEYDYLRSKGYDSDSYSIYSSELPEVYTKEAKNNDLLNKALTSAKISSEATNRITNLQNKTANSGFLDNREAPVVRSSFSSYTSTPDAVEGISPNHLFNDFGSKNHEFSVGGWLGLGASALAQIIGSAVAAKKTTPPDYTELNNIKNSITKPSQVQYKLTDFSIPQNRKTNIMPIDKTVNTIKSLSNTQRDAINESAISPGQRLAFLTKNNYDTINSIGNAYYEDALRNIEDSDKSYAAYVQNMQMKNAADQYNNDVINRAYQLNSQNDMDYQKLKLSTLLGIEQIKNQQNAAYDAARSSNWSNLFNSLSNIGMTSAYNSFAKDINKKNGGKIKRRRKHG